MPTFSLTDRFRRDFAVLTAAEKAAFRGGRCEAGRRSSVPKLPARPAGTTGGPPSSTARRFGKARPTSSGDVSERTRSSPAPDQAGRDQRSGSARIVSTERSNPDSSVAIARSRHRGRRLRTRGREPLEFPSRPSSQRRAGAPTARWAGAWLARGSARRTPARRDRRSRRRAGARQLALLITWRERRRRTDWALRPTH